MDTPQYRIILSGNTLPNHEIDDAIDGLAKLFNSDRARAESLLSGKSSRFGKAMDLASAQRHRQRLIEIGVECTLAAVTVEAAPPPAPAANTRRLSLVGDDTPHSPTTKPALAPHQMRCPKCGKVQDQTELCRECGIAVRKYQARMMTAASISPQGESTARVLPPADKSPKGYRWFLVCAAVALGAAWLYQRTPKVDGGTAPESIDAVSIVQPIRGVIAADRRHIMVITSDGTLYGWGRNAMENRENVKMLGVLNYDETQIPLRLDGPTHLRAVNAGTNAAYAIDSRGILWRRPFSVDWEKLRNNIPETYHPMFDALRWHKVEEYYGMTVGLSREQTLWVWNDDEIKPGIGGATPTLLKPLADGASLKWHDFCVAGRGFYAVSEDGALWSSDQPKGSITVLDTLNGTTTINLHAINAPAKFQRVFCRNDRVFLQDSNFHLWVFGSNSFGQLGIGKDPNNVSEDTNSLKPEEMQQVGTDRWVDVAIGFNATYAIRSDGSLWGWGRNMDSEVGANSTQSHFGAPVLIDDKHQWRAVAAPSDRVGLGVTAEGEVYTWGGKDLLLRGDASVPTPTLHEAGLRVKLEE